jgi:hypothetical protein
MRNDSGENGTGNRNTNFMLNNTFPPVNRAIHEVMWKNMVDPDRPQITI